eukprot:994159-Amphidinium_carterae.1
MTPVGTSSNKAMKTCVVHLYDLSENIRSAIMMIVGYSHLHTLICACTKLHSASGRSAHKMLRFRCVFAMC